MEQEVFKPITGYEKLYEVSNYGRIKSLGKSWSTKGKGRRTKTDTILAHSNNSGYRRVTLSNNSSKKSFSVHTIVAKEFCENPNKLPIVNHKNSKRDDNYFENLEWTTYKGNAVHAFNSGTRLGRKGELHHNVRYSERDIRIIRKLYLDGKYSQREIAEMFEDYQSNICRIIGGKRWQHI